MRVEIHRYKPFVVIVFKIMRSRNYITLCDSDLYKCTVLSDKKILYIYDSYRKPVYTRDRRTMDPVVEPASVS